MPEIQTITRTVYTYDELSDQAKARVAEWLNADLSDIESDIECFIDPDPEMQNYPAYVLPTYHSVRLMNGKTRREVDHYWSIEYGQYHLSVGYVFDIPEFMKAHKIAGKYRAIYNAAVRGDVTARVTTGPYSRNDKYNHLDIDEYNLPYSPETPANVQLDDQLRALLTADMEQRIDTLSGHLRAECEYHESPEYIAELCEINEYRFDEEGNPV